MKVLILNGSPRAKGSVSGCIAKKLKRLLFGCTTEIFQIKAGSEQEILEKFKSIDALVFALPLYVDGMPSHVIEFLKKAEAFCKENNCRFNVYTLSNNGFIEGRQNAVHLEQFRCWCARAGVEWAGGLGIGGGEMLRVLTLIYPWIILLDFCLSIFWLIKGAELNLKLFESPLRDIGIFSFFCFHFWFSLIAVSRDIRKSRKAKKNRFTRIIVPAAIFIVFADIFMVLSSLFKGRIIFTLLGKCKEPEK